MCTFVSPHGFLFRLYTVTVEHGEDIINFPLLIVFSLVHIELTTCADPDGG